ncbi:GNAT family N-acetyltransferase [Clostridium niameyense]|uniref:GNAT family N-acetyltransferase n=1 Tax=Clostridium niameyense TaxID=1622073 RepID=A0A6M0R5X6_9CLOT|nr:GNAT family N-acetyltransferase [Clostridium niameyense]NEZ45601.1 GNAT family N-acetyltransferase [Clostridium niameyense]
MKNIKIRYLNCNEFQRWDEFVDESPHGNIFNKSYWIKKVSNEFKILIAEENNRIVGGIVLPSMYNKLYKNPKLTPQLGVILFNPDKNQKYCSILSRQIEITEELINNLPKFKMFNYNFNYNYTNFLPFIWNDFNVNVKYTYIIEDLTDLEKVYNNFDYNTKSMIKRANKSNLKLTDKFGIKEFYEINKKTFDRQNIKMPYTLDFLIEMDSILEEKGNRKMLFALNDNNEVIAGVYILYDNNCAYYLMGGADPKFRSTGAQTFLIWESIRFASTVSKKFDFEGSMIKEIEKPFRRFGGNQKIIYNVYKSSKLTEIAYSFARKNKNIIRKIFNI